jgi:hypothetical protein
MRFVGAFLIAVLAATSASATPVTGSARDALAGGWREGGCGAAADENARTFTFEFAITGGQMYVESGDETARNHPVTLDQTGDKLTVTLDKTDKWIFTHKGDTLVSTKPADLYSGFAGVTFRRCAKPADRSAIHLDPKQTAAISSSMPGGPMLIDLRAKRGCKATEYQSLDFDLVGPLGFTLHRWRSMALGETLADGGKPSVVTDEPADFTIEKADAIPGGFRFTVTELIPPNGSRGDTTTIDVLIGKDHIATIPQWKRRYAICTHVQ